MLHKDPSFYTNRALCLTAMKKYQDSIEDCEEALQLDNKCIKAYYRMATNYMKIGNLKKASEILSNGIRLCDE